MKITDFKYEKNADGYTVTGYKGRAMDIEIPEGVTEIGYGAFSWCGIESIVFPKSLKKICTEAFSYCESLMTVSFPRDSALEEIESHAFLYCESLREVILPYGLKKIGEFSFASCGSLVDAFVPSSVKIIEENAFEYRNKKFRIRVDMAKIPSGFHKDWNMKADFELISSVKAASQSLTSKASAVAPKHIHKKGTAASPKGAVASASASVKSTQVLAVKAKPAPAAAYTPVEKFEVKDSEYGKILVKCQDKDIESLVIPPEIRIIGKKAFYQCYKLVSVKGHSDLACIDSEAFRECYNLRELDIPDGTTLCDYAFCGTALTHAKINFNTYDGVYSECPIDSVSFPMADGGYMESTIRPLLFAGSRLKSIEIPENVDSIMNGAFMGCRELSSVKLPESLSSLWANAFSSCASLNEIHLPPKINELPNGCFKFCEGLKKINLDNISVICAEALYACHSLEEIRIPGKTYRIGRAAIFSKSLRRIVFEGRTSEGFSKIHKGECWLIAGDYDVELVFSDRTVIIHKRG